MDEFVCPFQGCPLDKSGGCESRYREICEYHAEQHREEQKEKRHD